MHSKALGAVVALGLVAGAACSSGDDDDTTAPPDSAVDDRATDPNGGTTGDAAATSTTEGTGTDAGTGSGDGDTASSAADPLATVRAQLPADPSDRRLVPVRLDVVRFARTGDLIELDMLLTNEADPAGQDPPAFTPWSTFAEGTGTDLSNVGLLVSGEQKLYLPVFDSGSRCLCTGDLSAVNVPAGQALPLNATFGGVPDDVDTLDIRIPSFPMISGVGVEG
jgi:hypothetical protein